MKGLWQEVGEKNLFEGTIGKMRGRQGGFLRTFSTGF